MSDVQCIDCRHFDLRGSSLARNGFGLCGIGERWMYHPAMRHHDCPHFAPAPAPQIAARREWIGKQDQKDHA